MLKTIQLCLFTFVLPPFTLVAGSYLHFLTAPRGFDVSDQNKCSLISVNEVLLGITASNQLVGRHEDDIFSRPRAFAIVSVSSDEGFTIPSHGKCKLVDDTNHIESTRTLFSEAFGDDRNWLSIEANDIKGSSMVDNFKSTEANVTITDKSPMLRDELTSIYNLASFLKSAALPKHTSPDLYLIRINGLSFVEQQPTFEFSTAVEKLRAALSALASSLRDVYGDRVVLELIVKSSKQTIHSIKKRQSGMAGASDLKSVRSKLNVYSFTSEDYPAMFAIFAGTSILLSLTVLFIIVGSWNMDPGKDSIIYRMTSTRLKKD